MKYIISALALVSAFVLKAQTISGEVFDQVNREALVGAAVQVLGQDEGTVTNEQGEYQLTGLMPGRYSLRISYVGYQSKVITDVWVKAGKVTVQDVDLQQDLTLEEVTVYEDVMLAEPGRIYITEEQINRFAATYYDPARLATSSPDVAVANDQNNQVSVRGISPAYNTWRLEGAEIVNPNHLSNAGTFTDQPTATGGGVNMLSAQMLDRSVFLYSTFDNQYTNSVGGIFDMRLKNGNKLDRQYTAQASLIGFDLATEGPFKKGGRATYSANYRYSFTGLLTSFGVDFGGESIGFQDLALNLAFPVGKRSELKVFAVGGLSFNNFEHKPYDESEVAKDRSDIYYDNKTGAIGLNLINGFKQGKLSTTVALSGYENERHQNGYNDDDELIRETLFHSDETIFSFHSGWERGLSMFRLQLGGLLNYYTRHVTDVAVNQYLAQPYVQLSGPLGNHLTTSIGLTYYQTEDDQSWDPRGSVTYSFPGFILLV